MSRSTGWDGVWASITNEEECNMTQLDSSGNCGSDAVGVIFMFSYLVVMSIVSLMVYAVIYYNYWQATLDAKDCLNEDDCDMYHQTWKQFNAESTEYIRYDQLSEFLDALEPPLQITKFKKINLNIPICEGDLIFCEDILEAIKRDMKARNGIFDYNSYKEINTLSLEKQRISSTIWCQHKDHCTRIIQRFWRNRKQPKGDGLF